MNEETTPYWAKQPRDYAELDVALKALELIKTRQRAVAMDAVRDSRGVYGFPKSDDAKIQMAFDMGIAQGHEDSIAAIEHFIDQFLDEREGR